MAYELSNPIRRKSTGPGPNVWTYDDDDAVTTIDGSGYFNAEAGKLKVGDIIEGAGNSVAFMIRVVSNTRDLTANPPVSGIVDCSNNLLGATIDSD